LGRIEEASFENAPETLANEKREIAKTLPKKKP